MPPKEPTGLRRFRTTEDLWERFGEAVERGPDPEADMSKVLRGFVRWYVGDVDEVPQRPEPRRDRDERGRAE